jgi:predicted DNA-binding transcriptional regulator AlpA
MEHLKHLIKKPEPCPSTTCATAEGISGERLLNVKQVADITGLAVGTLNRARLTGADAPPFCKIGKSCRYKLSSLTAWMNRKPEYQHTSEHQQAA